MRYDSEPKQGKSRIEGPDRDPRSDSAGRAGSEEMIRFLESSIGQIIARNGILAVILAFSLWSNHNLVERLFRIIENNTKVMEQVKDTCGGANGR